MCALFILFKVPQAGWDKLFISFIPADSVKATAKTTKALVRNGTCKWGDPIYETTRLLQDTRNKQFDEKLYKIVVAMVSLLRFFVFPYFLISELIYSSLCILMRSGYF